MRIFILSFMFVSVTLASASSKSEFEFDLEGFVESVDESLKAGRMAFFEKISDQEAKNLDVNHSSADGDSNFKFNFEDFERDLDKTLAVGRAIAICGSESRKLLAKITVLDADDLCHAAIVRAIVLGADKADFKNAWK